MSLIGSLLALVAIPLKAKSRNLAAERPKEIDNLTIMALAEEVKLLTLALDHWRNSGNALMEENERLRADNWRMHDALAQFDPTSPYYRRRYESPQQAAQGQMQQYMPNLSYQGLGQVANQVAQNMAQQQQQFYAQQGGYQPDCTCVPARAQALRNDVGQ